jgi:hypothetical protein
MGHHILVVNGVFGVEGTEVTFGDWKDQYNVGFGQQD